ncbi:MAG: hypothetical protein WAK41_00360 [Roseiarcus sp.]|uniref:hypothetical protein n=1 Tax=Roseiarcus sp. TaxID=1969460 RepID=UPI003BB18552
MVYGAELACESSGRSSASSSLPGGGAPFPLPLIVAIGLALAGCNANQGFSASPQVVAGPYFPNYNPYDPTKYAQTSGFYAGR